MSLSDYPKGDEGAQSPWPRFEMAPLESSTPPPPPGEGPGEEFVCFEGKEGEGPHFVPLREGLGPYKKIKEAEEILKAAQRKAMELEKEAYEKGFAQGEKDGRELGQKRALKAVEGMETLLLEMGRLKGEILRRNEKEILELVFAIARKIIYREVQGDQEVVKQSILRALALAAEKSRVCLKVNPADLQYVERLKPELFSKLKEMKSIKVLAEPLVTRGGCIVETSCGDVDATIETQLERIYQSLDQACRQGED